MSTNLGYNLFVNTKNDEILNTWAELFVSHALLVREVESRLSGKAALSLNEYDVLLTVARSPALKIRFSDLATATVYTKSGITRIVKRLEASGYLGREVCEQDKRGIYAVLTDAGKKAMKETWKHYRLAVIELLDPVFNQIEVKELGLLLSKVVRHLQEVPLVQINRGK